MHFLIHKRDEDIASQENCEISRKRGKDYPTLLR